MDNKIEKDMKPLILGPNLDFLGPNLAISDPDFAIMGRNSLILGPNLGIFFIHKCPSIGNLNKGACRCHVFGEFLAKK